VEVLAGVAVQCGLNLFVAERCRIGEASERLLVEPRDKWSALRDTPRRRVTFGLDLVVGVDAVDQAHAQRFVSAEDAPLKQDFERLRTADQVDYAAQLGIGHDQPEALDRHAELAGLAAEAHVAKRRRLEPAADAYPLDQRESRVAARLERADRALDRRVVGTRFVAVGALGFELRDVGARRERLIKSVCVVHNDTATGITSDIPAIRKAIDRAGHTALFFVDTISSLGSIDYRHDEWGVDVTVGGSQKGLMLPPGLSFNAISKKALVASGEAKLPRSYWDWQDMLNANKQGVFPFTPATNLLYGLRESIRMLLEEGLDQVFSRHCRLAEATRAAVKAWGLELNALNPSEYSNSLTAVVLPQGHDADAFRKGVLECFNVSLGNGLGRLNGKVFRIGHLGDLNEPMLLGTLGAIEMGLELAEIPHRPEGARAAMSNLIENNR